MIFRKKKKKPNPPKAKRLEAKGDQLKDKSKLRDALKVYRESLEADPENIGIYDKLIGMKTLIDEDWSEEDFAESMTWTMKKQELENPALKGVYETLSPEYAEIKQLIAQMLSTPPELRDPIIQKIINFEGKAVRPLLDILLSIEAMARGQANPLQEDSPPPPTGGNAA